MRNTAAALKTSERSRVLSSAVVEAANRMGIGPSDLSLIVGVSQPTASRLLKGDFKISEGTKTWELSAYLVRIYHSLSLLVGGDEALINAWLKTPNASLNQQIPLEYLQRAGGLIYVCHYLDATAQHPKRLI